MNCCLFALRATWLTALTFLVASSGCKSNTSTGAAETGQSTPQSAKNEGKKSSSTPTSDLDSLQGRWTVVSIQVGGSPEQKNEDLVMEIKGDAASMYKDGKRRETENAKLTIDSSKSPKQIDILESSGPEVGKVHKGIYLLEGNKFTIYFSEDPKGARPDKFETPKEKYQVLKLERAK
jgi:uncharacterized protein (TIGR03067 family)